jgi:hypothetical protein
LRCPDRSGEESRGFTAVQAGPRVLRQRRFESFDGIIFYPILKHNGYKIRVLGWPIDSVGDSVLAEVYGGWEEPPYEVDHTSDSFEKAKRELTANGWEWVEREGFRKELPIASIEKTEGPPC